MPFSPTPPCESARGWIEVWAPLQTRPLTYFTFWLNRQIGGGDPLGYHLFNLLFHLGAVLLAWECLRRLLPERAALIAGVLFALHPIQSEAVNYVWARSIVLASLFCFGALWHVARRASLDRSRMVRRARCSPRRNARRFRYCWSGSSGAATCRSAAVEGGAGRHVRARPGRRGACHLGDRGDPRRASQACKPAFPQGNISWCKAP